MTPRNEGIGEIAPAASLFSRCSTPRKVTKAKSAPARAKMSARRVASVSVKMIIASDYGDAREVQRLIREEVEKAGFDPDSQFAIKLALEEALINAIKHGNSSTRTSECRSSGG